jgi:hypothetical protein
VVDRVASEDEAIQETTRVVRELGLNAEDFVDRFPCVAAAA